MNKGLYIIHLNDYLNHIDNKLEMYELLLKMVQTLREDLLNGEASQAARTLCGYEQQAHEMFEGWCIPDEYVETGELEELSQLMEEELLPCEDEDGEETDSEDTEGLLLSSRLLNVAGMLTRCASAMLEVTNCVADVEQTLLLDEDEKPENGCAE